MAHHDHHHRNRRREKFVPATGAFVHMMRTRAEQDSANTTPLPVASVGLWNLAMDENGHLVGTYGPTGDAVVLALAPVPPPPTTVRAATAPGERAAGTGQASPAILALIGGLPTSLPVG